MGVAALSICTAAMVNWSCGGTEQTAKKSTLKNRNFRELWSEYIKNLSVPLPSMVVLRRRCQISQEDKINVSEDARVSPEGKTKRMPPLKQPDSELSCPLSKAQIFCALLVKRDVWCTPGATSTSAAAAGASQSTCTSVTFSRAGPAASSELKYTPITSALGQEKK